LFWVFLFAFVTLLVAYRLKKGTFGRAFLSIREDEIASEAMGVNTTRYKVWAFVIAAFFAGIAGGLFAHTLGVGLSPQAAGFQKSFDIIIMVVLGGLVSISGATIAAVVVTLLPEYLRPVAEYRMIIFALSLILMMIFRPQGLLGVRELWDKALWRDAASFFTRRKAVPRG
jgi:branched-chain amino acid transport system permease protein